MKLLCIQLTERVRRIVDLIHYLNLTQTVLLTASDTSRGILQWRDNFWSKTARDFRQANDSLGERVVQFLNINVAS